MTATASEPPTAETSVPSWVKDEIDHPLAMGEGRNNQMVRIGPTLLRNGMDVDALEELFQEMYPDIGPQQVREIAACVKNCAKLAAREQKEIDKTAYGQRKIKLDRMSIDARLALPMILDKYAWTESEIRGSSSMSGFSLDAQRRTFLNTMFDQDDVVWIGAIWMTGEKRDRRGEATAGNWAVRFKENRSWLTLPRIPGEFTSHCTFKSGSFSRCIEQVARRRYLVVESDVLTKDQVGAVFNYLASPIHGLNLRAVVSSGGKSLHGWFDWPGDDFLEEWVATLKGWQCDPATTRASQPVRIPGCIRTATQRPQELLYLS